MLNTRATTKNTQQRAMANKTSMERNEIIRKIPQPIER